MNQKDYKAIAGIIGKFKKFYSNYPIPTKFTNVAFISDLKAISFDLADYFEKEDIERKTIVVNKGEHRFNKKQFLKDCGDDKE